MWQNPAYIENWTKGMAGAGWVRPTTVEKQFIQHFHANKIDARYTGDGTFWVNYKGADGKNHVVNPDFKVNGQRKLIEVYTSDLPAFMQDRTTDAWIKEKQAKYKAGNFDSLFIDIKNIDTCLLDVQRFIHNGIALKAKKPLKSNKYWKGRIKTYGDFLDVYDLVLEDGANVYFVDRLMSHNCGSAIASSSLATEWLKGKSISEAEALKNTQIVEELSLPPVKIHCSVLAEDAIKAAIADYKKKNNLN
jgi:hypothetical protein